MTYTKLSNAASAITEFGKIQLPFSTSRKLFFLIRNINLEIEFYIAEENKLLEKYHAVRSEDGRVVFEKPIDFQNYIGEMKQLNSTEVEISGTPLILKEQDFENAKISPETLVNLDGIIEFE